MKTSNIIQGIFGITTIISFVLTVVSGLVFKNNFYGTMFFSLFWIFFPLSIYMNKFTRKWNFSKGYYFLMILMLILGVGVMTYFIFQVASYKTVYSFNLEKTGEVYEGSFIIPENINLNNKTHLIELEISYKHLSSFRSQRTILIEVTTPNKNFTETLIIRADKDSWLITINKRLDNQFIPKEGNYLISFIPEEDENRIIISSVKVRVKEFR